MPTKKYTPEEIIKLLSLVDSEGGLHVRCEYRLCENVKIKI